MAKRSKSDTNKTIVTILTFVFLILAVLIAEQAGIDVFNEEDGDSTLSGDNDNNSNVAVENYVGEGTWYSLYFTEPLNTNDESLHVGAPVEAAILQSINNANSTIDGALFELNLERVTQALINARNRGVQVRLVLDDDNAIFEEDDRGERVKSETTHTFERAGWVIYCEDQTPSTYDIRCDDRGDLMHNKFLIIDSSVVWMGSMNYTHNGVYNNNNNALSIRSTRLAANYQSEFDEMFLNGIFTRSADTDNVPYPQITIRDENAGDVQIETYFSPEDGAAIESRLVELVQQADTSVLMMAFSATLDSVGEAMVERHNANVDVQAIFEQRGSETQYSEMGRLVCNNVPFKQDGNPNTFHHKVIIIDNEIVVTGSFNFSSNAQDNSENLLVIHSPEIAQQFTAEFTRRFNDPRAAAPTIDLYSKFGCPR